MVRWCPFQFVCSYNDHSQQAQHSESLILAQSKDRRAQRARANNQVTDDYSPARDNLPIVPRRHDLSTYFTKQGSSNRNVAPHGVGVSVGDTVGIRVIVAVGVPSGVLVTVRVASGVGSTQGSKQYSGDVPIVMNSKTSIRPPLSVT